MELESLLNNPAVWVAISTVLFVAGIYRPLGRFIGTALDKRSARIRSELDEAQKLREEAEAVLHSYQQKQQEALAEADAILQHARREAEQLAARAEVELKESIETRRKQAVEKIAQAEAKAVQDVKGHVVDIAISAARSLILQHVEKGSADALINLAIADIERKVH